VCRALLLVIAAAALHSALAADVPLAFRNPGMEEGTSTPADWAKGPPVAGVQHLWDQKKAHSGKASLCLQKTAQRYFPVAQWSQSLPVEPAGTARKLRIRCWVKAEAVTKAIIDTTYQGEGQRSGHAWAVYLGQKQDTDPVLTHDWKLYEGVVEVPANTSKIGVAFQIYGPGSVWFDDLQVAWAHN
jgi:RNA polymerase sigma-70 factor (ECF subfamily)